MDRNKLEAYIRLRLKGLNKSLAELDSEKMSIYKFESNLCQSSHKVVARIESFPEEYQYVAYRMLSILSSTFRWTNSSDTVIENAFDFGTNPKVHDVFVSKNLEKYLTAEYNYYITEYKEKILWEKFYELAFDLQETNRVSNSIPVTFSSVLDVVLTGYGIKKIQLGKFVGKKTKFELEKISERFIPIYYNEIFASEDNVKLNQISELFQISNEDVLNNIYEFYQNHQRFPMFYIVENFLKEPNVTNDSIYRKIKIFSFVNGFIDGLDHKIEEAAYLFGITRERARQLMDKESFVSSFDMFNIERWETYDFFKEAILTKNEYEKIKAIENIECSYEQFCVICNMTGAFNLYSFSSRGKEFFGRAKGVKFTYTLNSKFNVYDFYAALSDIKEAIPNFTDNKCVIDIRKYTKNKKYWKNQVISEQLCDDIFNLLLKFSKEVLKIEISDDGLIVVLPNRINYNELIYKIFVKQQKPLHLSEISKLLKKKLPADDVHYQEKYLRVLISKDERIEPIGRKSRYKLTTWTGTTKSLNAIVSEVVSLYNEPRKASEIIPEVLSLRPDSSERSIAAILSIEVDAGKLVKYVADRYGLKGVEYSSEFHLEPKTFDETLSGFIDFVDTNKRFPFAGKLDWEGFLYRWYYESKKLLGLTERQIEIFYKTIKKYEDEHIPSSKREFSFCIKCDQIRKFAISNKRLISKDEDNQLYSWYSKNQYSYEELDDFEKFHFNKISSLYLLNEPEDLENLCLELMDKVMSTGCFIDKEDYRYKLFQLLRDLYDLNVLPEHIHNKYANLIELLNNFYIEY